MERISAEGTSTKDNTLEEELLHPTVRTGSAWVELEGRKVPTCARYQDWPPAPLLTPTRALRRPPPLLCLHSVLR